MREPPAPSLKTFSFLLQIYLFIALSATLYNLQACSWPVYMIIYDNLNMFSTNKASWLVK